jgi:polyisoprenyl-phosphate glycosyltransferase
MAGDGMSKGELVAGIPGEPCRASGASSQNHGVSLIIPAYNEAVSIQKVVADAGDVLTRCETNFEVIVVDDGSEDGTGELAQQAGARVVCHPCNRGYGNSLRSGITAAAYENVIICDADQSYPLEQLTLLLEYADRYDMVVGARQGAYFHGSFSKRIARAFQLGLVHFTVGTRVPDANSGFRLIKRSLATRYFDFVCSGFSFTTSITIAMLCEQRLVMFVPIEYLRREGKSHVRYVRDTARSLQIILQCMLRYNPLKAFLALSLASLVPAFALLLVSPLQPACFLASAMFGSVSLLTMGMGMLAYAAGRQASSPVDAGVYAWPSVRVRRDDTESRAA